MDIGCFIRPTKVLLPERPSFPCLESAVLGSCFIVVAAARLELCPRIPSAATTTGEPESRREVLGGDFQGDVELFGGVRVVAQPSLQTIIAYPSIASTLQQVENRCHSIQARASGSKPA